MSLSILQEVGFICINLYCLVPIGADLCACVTLSTKLGQTVDVGLQGSQLILAFMVWVVRGGVAQTDICPAQTAIRCQCLFKLACLTYWSDATPTLAAEELF